MYEYCNRRKLIVNIDKTKVVIFRKGGRIPKDIEFLYDGKRVDMVNNFNYLGVVFRLEVHFRLHRVLFQDRH